MDQDDIPTERTPYRTLNATGAAPAPQLELRCQVDTSMLALLREFVCSVARHLGFSESQVLEIELCVDEACANAIEHAFETETIRSPGEMEMGAAVGERFANRQNNISVEIHFATDAMTIRIVDNGSGSEQPMGASMLQLEQYLDQNREKFRGLGFQLMHRFMDKVDVRTVPGLGTTVEMTKIRR